MRCLSSWCSFADEAPLVATAVLCRRARGLVHSCDIRGGSAGLHKGFRADAYIIFGRSAPAIPSAIGFDLVSMFRHPRGLSDCLN